MDVDYFKQANDTCGHTTGDSVLRMVTPTRRYALVEHSRLDMHGEGLAVTLSIGGTLLQPGDTSEHLVHWADELMYRSKKAGRNRVTIG